jgi:hypothetical protein
VRVNIKFELASNTDVSNGPSGGEHSHDEEPSVDQMRESLRAASHFVYGQVSWLPSKHAWVAEHYATKGAGQFRQQTPADMCWVRCVDPYAMACHKAGHAKCVRSAYRSKNALEDALLVKEQTGSWPKIRRVA